MEFPDVLIMWSYVGISHVLALLWFKTGHNECNLVVKNIEGNKLFAYLMVRYLAISIFYLKEQVIALNFNNTTIPTTSTN